MAVATLHKSEWMRLLFDRYRIDIKGYYVGLLWVSCFTYSVEEALNDTRPALLIPALWHFPRALWEYKKQLNGAQRRESNAD